jgi:hypothetical protein
LQHTIGQFGSIIDIADWRFFQHNSGRIFGRIVDNFMSFIVQLTTIAIRILIDISTITSLFLCIVTHGRSKRDTIEYGTIRLAPSFRRQINIVTTRSMKYHRVGVFIGIRRRSDNSTIDLFTIGNNNCGRWCNCGYDWL